MLTEKQKDLRRTGLGGSDIATLLGLNPYKTPFELYQDKVHGNTVEERESMYWGNALEEPIARRYAELTGRNLIECDTVRHPTYPYFLANPDRLINDSRIGLEIKTVGPRQTKLWGEAGSQIIPEYYYPQIMHYLFVFDYDEWDVAALLNGQEMRLYTFKRDKEFDQIIIDAGTKFWKEHVEPQIPPPISYTDPNSLILVRKLYKNIQPVETQLFHVEPWKQIYLDAKQKAKEFNGVMDEAMVHILEAMEEAEKGLFEDGSYFLRKKVSVKGYTVQPKDYISFSYKGVKKDDGTSSEADTY